MERKFYVSVIYCVCPKYKKKINGILIEPRKNIKIKFFATIRPVLLEDFAEIFIVLQISDWKLAIKMQRV